MEKKIDLSLVIACYNEAPHLDENFKKIAWVLKNLKITYEIIFVDDCSGDKTKSIIEKIVNHNPGIKFKTIFHKKNIGRGGSVAEGIKIAAGDVVGFIDVDLEMSEHYISAFYWKIKEGNDMAIARRIYEFTFSKIIRYVGSKSYAFLVRFLLKSQFADTEAGYKFFNRKKILIALEHTHDKKWFWDTEIVLRSSLAGLHIAEIPAIFIRNPQKKSTVRLLPDSLEYIKKIFAFRKEVK